MSVRQWPAIDIQQPGACSDPDGLEGAILAALDDAGVSAVQELPFGWRIFFTTTGSREAAMATLANWKPELVVSALDISDEDWARRSQENLGPVCVGRVRIAPPWLANAEATRDEARSNPDAVIDIVILPSMGFGTGHHATTRLCAALLQQIDLSGRRVLDVGTGSGVLAIVAARLGAGSVLAVDDDPDALESARENLGLNGIASGKAEGSAAVELRQADFRQLKAGLFGVVTANLTGGLLVRGADELLGAVSPDGRLILSGITRDEEASVRARFEAHLPLLARVEEDDWIGLLLGSRRVNAEG